MTVEPVYKPKKKRSKWVGIILLLVFAPFALLILTEAALRLFAPVGPSPAVSYKLTQDEPGLEKEFLYAQNSDGMRTEGLETAVDPKKTIRVLVTGGDFGSCPLQSSGKAWWGVLQDSLNARLKDKGWQVQVSCLTAMHSDVFTVYMQIRSRLRYAKPDIVVVCVGLEDHLTADLTTANFKPGERLAWAENEITAWGGRLPFTQERLAEISQIYQRLSNARAKKRMHSYFRGGLGVNPYWKIIEEGRKEYEKLPMDADVLSRPNRTALFEPAVNRVYQWLGQQQVNFVAIGQPTIMGDRMEQSSYQKCWMPLLISGTLVKGNTTPGPVGYRMHPGDFKEQLQKFNDVNRDAVLAQGGWYVPLEQLSPNPDFFVDECNLTDAGQAAAAGFVDKQMTPLIDEFIKRAEAK